MNNRYEISIDGLEVKDHQTDLIWQGNINKKIFTFDDALNYTSSINKNTCGSPWRVPSIHELQSLLDYSKYNPTSTFPMPKDNLDPVWTSSLYAGDPNYAWIIIFYNGYIDLRERNSKFAIRLVRDFV